MSKLDNRKTEYISKIEKIKNPLDLDNIKTEIFGKNGFLTLEFKKLGKIYLDEKDITKFPMYKRAQSGIGYLAQEASVFRTMSVEDNLLSVLEMRTLSKDEQFERCESLLDEFGLQDVRKNMDGLL